MPPKREQVRILVAGLSLDVVEGQPLLRCFEAFAADRVGQGNYCWNGECGHCEVTYDSRSASARVAMACSLPVFDGLRVTGLSRYLQTDLEL